MTNNKKVFVSGCFDVFHSGHVKFLEEASKLGEVHVGVGSDKTLRLLKQRAPVNNEQERLFMVKQCKYVTDAFINTGIGKIDFEKEIKSVKPDFFFVNEDGDSPEKRKLCRDNGVFYVLGDRVPQKGLIERSSTEIVKSKSIPYRIDLAGGWLDQPFVNKCYQGAVVTICIEPNINIDSMSGFASSTRSKAISLWGNEVPEFIDETQRYEEAKRLFKYENEDEPQKGYSSGSQDAFGIVYPGANIFYYRDNEDIPVSIESCLDEDVLQFLEDHIRIINSNKRIYGYNVLKGSKIKKEAVCELYNYTELVWNAIKKKNLIELGKNITNSYRTQVELFPQMLSSSVSDVIRKYKDEVLGYKILGAGGGGGVLLVTDKEIENSYKIKIKR